MNAQPPYIDPVAALQRDPTGYRPERAVEPEQAVAALLREHGPREGEALAAYEQLVEHCDDEAVRYLATLILDDERRHHRLIEEMLNQIQSFLWEVDLEPKVPHLVDRVDPEMRAAVDRLIEVEQEDAKELRRLRREVRGQASASLLPLLVKLMIHDTAKHIEILKVVRAHTKKR